MTPQDEITFDPSQPKNQYFNWTTINHLYLLKLIDVLLILLTFFFLLFTNKFKYNNPLQIIFFWFFMQV